MPDNTDLVGKEYCNGPDGARYRVMRVCRFDPDFVSAQGVSNRRHATALASFVRKAIEDEEREGAR